MFSIAIINLLLFLNQEKCKEPEIETYTSKKIYYQKNEAIKKLIDAEKSVQNSEIKIISTRVNESEEGYYYFEIDLKPIKGCKNFEIRSYEIDYSNSSQKEAIKNLKTKYVDVIAIQDDNYDKKINVSYIVKFINFGCLKGISKKNYKLMIYDLSNSENLKTSIKNRFRSLKLPYFTVEGEDEYVNIDYPSCTYEKSLEEFEIKRYNGFLYQNRKEAYKSSIIAKDAFEKVGIDVFYFNTYEENGEYSFFIDWISKQRKMVYIKSYNSKKIYDTKDEAMKDLLNSIKNIESKNAHILEHSINSEQPGYSFIIRYIEKQ